MALGRVGVLSLEPWDDVWRRNQHFASRLVGGGHASSVLFVEPPQRGQASRRAVAPDIDALTPQLRIPRRLGGLRDVARRLAPDLAGVDVLWINDPRLGAHCLRPGQPTLYDVTDDWRAYPFPPRILRRIEQAEKALAARATTVVCSAELARRWHERYGVETQIVHNGVDLDAFAGAQPRVLAGPRPRYGYVGTLQPERLDIALVQRLARATAGSVHLIGPDALDDAARAALAACENVHVAPPVAAAEVAATLLAMDVLISPHLVNPFTLSLDAIKAYEYLAARRPVAATPTSGFQDLRRRPGVLVAEPERFVDAALAAADPHGPRPTPDPDSSWDQRTAAFAAALATARA